MHFGNVATAIAARYTVLRSSVVYGRSSENFAKWALDELDAGGELTIVDDQTSSPTYAPDLAQAVLDAVEMDITGTFHAAGPAAMTRYDFTLELAEAFGYDPALVTPISTDELGQDAPRPRDSSLDSSRLYERLSHSFREPREGFTAMQR